MALVRVTVLLLAICAIAPAAPQGNAQPASDRNPVELHELARIRPGCWAALGENTLFDVRYVPEPGGRSIETIMTAWSGAAYNSDLDQLWVHGGGHADGADNAVYAFDVEQLRWYRLFEPSTVVTGHSERYYLDGKPAAVHSYDYIEYMPALGRMVVAGACGPFPSSNLYPTVDAVDSAGDWMHLWDVPSSVHPMAAVHPVTGILWHHGGEGAGFLSSFDPGLGRWTSYGDSFTDNLPGCYRTAAIDPVHERFVAINIADGGLWSWNITTGIPGGEVEGYRLNMTGDTDVLYSAGAPGFEWHPSRRKFYAWYGGVDVYEIDTGAQSVTLLSVSPMNQVVPTSGTTHGVYGRWRYVEKFDVFLGVNSVYEPVFFFRLPN